MWGQFPLADLGQSSLNYLIVEVFFDNLRPLVWNDQAFDHLVYDEEQKDLIISLVKSHDHATSSVEDVIAGKGKKNAQTLPKLSRNGLMSRTVHRWGVDYPIKRASRNWKDFDRRSR